MKLEKKRCLTCACALWCVYKLWVSGSVFIWRGSSVAVEVRGVLLGVTGVPSLPGVPAEHKTSVIHRQHTHVNGPFCIFTSALVFNTCSFIWWEESRIDFKWRLWLLNKMCLKRITPHSSPVWDLLRFLGLRLRVCIPSFFIARGRATCKSRERNNLC